MAKKKEIYNYKNPQFYNLRDPMRGVMTAYMNAEKWFATIKEITWAEFGMKFLTDGIHAYEHLQPEAIDEFKGIMAQYGLEVEYPATSELTEEFPDLDRVFEVCVQILDEINVALSRFIKETNNETFEPLARQAEQLQINNSMLRTKMLEAWSMFDGSTSLSSFDKWCKSLFDDGGDDE